MAGALTVACVACVGACGTADDRGPELGGLADGSVAQDAVAEPDTGTPADAGLESDAATESGQQVVVPETHGAVQLPFSVDASGDGVARVKQIDIAANRGGYLFNDAQHVAFAYQTHSWGAAGYDLYDVVSLAKDGSDFAVSYLYCQTGSLPFVYSESFSEAMAVENASGTCVGAAQATSTQVDLPALTARPTFLQTGITVSADGLTLGQADGQVTLDGKGYDLVPFNTVDCSTCPGGPWLELHSMLLGDAEACFGIVYLFPNAPTTIQLGYVVCLPGLEQTSTTFTGSWSGALKSSLRRKVLFRPRPPFPVSGP